MKNTTTSKALSRQPARKTAKPEPAKEPSGVHLVDLVRRAVADGQPGDAGGELLTHLASFIFGRKMLKDLLSGRMKAERESLAAADRVYMSHAPGDLHDAEWLLADGLAELSVIAATLDEELRGADETNGNWMLLDALRAFAKVRVSLGRGLDQLRRGIAEFEALRAR